MFAVYSPYESSGCFLGLLPALSHACQRRPDQQTCLTLGCALGPCRLGDDSGSGLPASGAPELIAPVGALPAWPGQMRAAACWEITV